MTIGTRKEFMMSDSQRAMLFEHMKAQPVMFLSGGQPMYSSQQENANQAWNKLGDEMGFDGMTVKRVTGKSDRYFSAITKEPAMPAEETAKELIRAPLTVEDLIKKLEALPVAATLDVPGGDMLPTTLVDVNLTLVHPVRELRNGETGYVPGHKNVVIDHTKTPHVEISFSRGLRSKPSKD